MFDAKTANTVEVCIGELYLLRLIPKDYWWRLKHRPAMTLTAPTYLPLSWVDILCPVGQPWLFTQWGSDSKFASQWVPGPCWPGGVPCSLATFPPTEIPPDQKPGTNFGNIVDPMSNTQQRMQKDQKISGSSWEINKWWVRGSLHRVPCLWAVSRLGLKLWIYYQNHYVVLKTWVCIKQL